jgi:hypothetical protein
MTNAKEHLIKLIDDLDVETLTEEGVIARHEALEAEGLESIIGNVYRDLYDIAARFTELPQDDRIDVLPHMFGLIERAGDLELGAGPPGPIVHAIETTEKAFFPFLLSSVVKLPTPTSVLMINRWANYTNTTADLLPLLATLENVATHPNASATTKKDALGYLNYQRSCFES